MRRIISSMHFSAAAAGAAACVVLAAAPPRAASAQQQQQATGPSRMNNPTPVSPRLLAAPVGLNWRKPKVSPFDPKAVAILNQV